VLGVSRVAEIDTTGGPRFGEQYPGDHLLQAGEVVLTFDDGPFPNDTKAILDALAAQCTKATFFNVGGMAAAYPDLAKEVASQGRARHCPDRDGLHRRAASARRQRRTLLPVSLSQRRQAPCLLPGH
jgi:peptidoglycan/xylan/chitin deacetylase (PgdA/CDA1 family)